MPDLPIVCTLGPVALAARREGLLSDLMRRADDHQDLLEGHRDRFPADRDTFRAIRARRRRGEPMLPISAVPDHRGTGRRPRLVGPDRPTGTREFLSALLDS
jgi:hypothetical protein